MVWGIGPGQFGGMIPKVSRWALPAGGAYNVINADLRGGVLKPLLQRTPTQALNDGSTMNAGIGTSELTRLGWTDADAARPVVTSMPHAMSTGGSPGPAGWLTIYWSVYISYVDAAQQPQTDQRPGSSSYREMTFSNNNVKFTDTGMIIEGTLDAWSYFFEKPDGATRSYSVSGPKFQFVFTQDSTGANGGPIEAITTPAALGHGSALLGNTPISLHHENRIYARLQAVDFDGQLYDEVVEPGASFTQNYAAQTVRLYFNFNYVEPLKRIVYVATKLDDQLREGPPTSLSDVVTLLPGRKPVIELTDDGQDYTRIYQSIPGSDEFFLLADNSANTDGWTGNTEWQDDWQGVQAERMPEYGDYPTGATAAQFLEGSAVHPYLFGVAGPIDNSPLFSTTIRKRLYLSDKERLHAWPEEWQFDFQDVKKAVMVSGVTILVWEGDRLWGFSASSPENIGQFLMSDSAPLLNKFSLARIHNVIYYVSHDGVYAVEGSRLTNVTEQYFDRNTWYDLWGGDVSDVTAVTAFVADEALFLVGETVKLRIDFNEGRAAITKYTATDGTGQVTWETARRYDQPMTFDTLRVVADDYTAITVTLTNGAGTAYTRTQSQISSDGYVDLVALSMTPSREWTLKIDWTPAAATDELRSIEVFERQYVDTGLDLTLSDDNVACWKSVWARLPEAGKWCCGTVNAQTGSNVSIELYSEANPSLAIVTLAVPANRAFRILRNFSTLSDKWRVRIATDVRINSLRLMARRAVPIERSLREVNEPGSIAPWCYKRYEVRGTAVPQALYVKASQTVTVAFYIDGATSAAKSATITGGNGWVDLSTIDVCSSFEFEFTASLVAVDHLVDEVLIVMAQPQVIGDGPIDINDPAAWIGNMYKFPDRGKFAAIDVAAGENRSSDDVWPVTLDLRGDGTADLSDFEIDDGKLKLLPLTLPERSLWTVSLEPTAGGVIHRARLYPRVRVDVGRDADRIDEFSRDTGVWPWAYRHYDFGSTARQVVCGRVRADSYPITLYLYKDGATSATQSVVISGEDEFAITGMGEANDLIYNFGGTDDYKVNRVELGFLDPIEIGVEGHIMRRLGPETLLRNRRLVFKDTGSFSVVRVVADNYPVTVVLTSDNGDVETMSIASDDEVACSEDLEYARGWRLDVQASGVVRELHLIGKRVHWMNHGAITVRHEQDPFSWLRHKLLMRQYKTLNVGRVVATKYPVEIWLYYRGEYLTHQAVDGPGMFRFKRFHVEREITMDVIADDDRAVLEVQLATSAGLLTRS